MFVIRKILKAGEMRCIIIPENKVIIDGPVKSPFSMSFRTNVRNLKKVTYCKNKISPCGRNDTLFVFRLFTDSSYLFDIPF